MRVDVQYMYQLISKWKLPTKNYIYLVIRLFCVDFQPFVTDNMNVFWGWYASDNFTVYSYILYIYVKYLCFLQIVKNKIILR